MAATTREDRLAALYLQRDTLLDRIAAAGSAPRQVAVVGSVSYEERSVEELRAALSEVEARIIQEETPGGRVRILPRYV